MAIAIDTCRHMNNPERLTLWRSMRGDLPEGMRLGSTCRLPYCGNIEHMAVVANKNYGQQHWGEYAATIAALALDESIDFPEFPNDSKSVVKFRTSVGNVRSCFKLKFIVRALPTGFTGIRVTRIGEWGDGREIKRPPLLLRRAIKNVWLNCGYCKQAFLVPRAYAEERKYCSHKCASMARWGACKTGFKRSVAHVQYLGFMCWSSAADVEILSTKCPIKACPYPQRESGLCRFHENWYAYAMSMTYGAIDFGDLYNDDDPTDTRLRIATEAELEEFEGRLVMSSRHKKTADNVSVNSRREWLRVGRELQRLDYFAEEVQESRQWGSRR